MCLFCKIVSGEIPSTKVYEDEHVAAFLDIKPKSEHHTLVIPKAHYVNILDMPADELSRVMAAVKHIAEEYRGKYGLENFNIVHNAGAKAGQEVYHFHTHIIPRR